MSVNPVLQHTHYLKARYQRNMLIAEATVVVFIGTLAGVGSLLLQSPGTRINLGPGENERARWISQINLAPPPVVTVDRPHRGKPEIALPLFADVTLLPGEELATPLVPDIISGDQPTDGQDIGDEQGWPEFDELGVGKPGGNRTGIFKAREYTQPQVRVDPVVVRDAMIRVPRPKFRRYQDLISAEVTALIDYTSSGRIRRVTILSEDPEGVGFARSLREAINECQLWPRKYSDGHCDSGQIRLTYRWQPGGRDSTWSQGIVVQVQ